MSRAPRSRAVACKILRRGSTTAPQSRSPKKAFCAFAFSCANRTEVDSQAFLRHMHEETRCLSVARLPALIKAYAALDGRDPKIIAHIARVIREAKLMPTTKAGWGASTMSERDVVNLVLGANGAESAAGAPEAVKRLRAFEQKSIEILRIPNSEDRLNYVLSDQWMKVVLDEDSSGEGLWAPIAKISNFGDACEWLVTNAPTIKNRLSELARRWYVESIDLTDDLRKELTGKKLNEEEKEIVAKAVADSFVHPGKARIGLTIAKDYAIFQAGPNILSQTSNSLNIRIVYGDAGDALIGKALESPRQSFATLDFSMFHELAVLVADKSQQDHDEAEEV